MRVFEIILLSLCVVAMMSITFRKKGQKKVEFSIIVSFVFAHFLFEGYRWQMLPAYFLILLLLLVLHKSVSLTKGGWAKKIFKILGIISLLLMSVILPSAIPIFELPKPTGNYKIGSQYLYLKTHRNEDITAKENDKRALMIKVWYPARINSEVKEAYLNDGDRIGFAAKYNLPLSTFKYLDYIKTNTHWKPIVADEKFPILIFSHGYYSKASGYYALIEEMVSHGYIVLNINHTYESVGSLFPDGSIKPYNKDYDKKHVSSQEMVELAWKSQQDFINSTSEKEQFWVSKSVLKKYIGATITTRWSKDIISVIDELQNWNSSTFLTNHIDTSKIGVFGHSQGGSAIGQAILEDNRISAGANLDGVQWGSMIDTTLSKPFLLLSSDWKSPHPNFNKYAYSKGSTSVFYDAKIKNSGHASFMDIPFIINIPQLNEAGTINPRKALKIINKTLVSFFDNHLKNQNKNLRKLQEKYPSLEIEIKKNSNH